MPRGLDHIVHAVRDLDGAAALYRALGFQVGARNRHPPAWGTQNHIVQLPGVFVELLALADAAQIAPHAPRFFSFGAFNRDFLARGQGLSMLVLEGRGAPDAAAFRTAGIGDFALYQFEREAKRPDGAAVKVAFALAFAADARAPDIGFFTCQHRHPENFWNPAFQNHANTAAGMAGVVLVADNPADHRDFLSAFVGKRDVLPTSAGIGIKTPRGEIAVMEPNAFASRFGVPPPDVANGARLAAVRFAVRDLGAAQALWRAAGLAPRMHEGCAVLGPGDALDATLVFQPT
jgi:hypothetical protein